MAINVGIDIGGSVVKFCFVDKSGKTVVRSFPNRVSFDYQSIDGYKVNVNGEQCFIGSTSGLSNQTVKKINYQNLPHILLTVAYEISNVYKDDLNTIHLNLATCLPPTQFQESKEAYKSLFINLNGLKGVVQGKEITVQIDSVKCGAEGVVLLSQLNLQEKAKDVSSIVIIDVGSSTTDIVSLLKINQIWKVKQAVTSQIAGARICQDLALYLNKMYHGNYNWQDLEMSGVYQVNYKSYPISSIVNEASSSLKQLVREIERVALLSEYLPIVTGRGATLLENYAEFNKKCKPVITRDIERIYGNATGCLLSLTQQVGNRV